MYDEPREHDYLDFYLLVIQQVAHHEDKDDQDKLATWHEMFLKNSIPQT